MVTRLSREVRREEESVTQAKAKEREREERKVPCFLMKRERQVASVTATTTD